MTSRPSRTRRGRPLRLAAATVAALTAAALGAGCSNSSPGNGAATSSSERPSSGTAAPPRSRGTSATRGTTGSSTPSGTAGSGTSSAPSSPSGGPDETLSAKVRLTQVGTADQPVAMTNRPGSPVLYIAEQEGRVRTLRVGPGGDASVDSTPLLDLTSEVDGRGERGLLGLAFSPDGNTLFVYFTDKTGRIHVDSYRMQGDRLDTASRTELLSLQHDRPNHNGGQLATGPDGFLYVGVGDGGGGGDPDRNGQNTDTLYGKILRIDPATKANGKNYSIPPGNPFANGGGAPEVWIYGARNPWRFSFDRQTGDLWVGDVGQNEIEEIDFLPNIAGEGAGRGANLGWSNMEGSRPFKGGSPPTNHTPPVFEYNHDNGECSVITGYVYRGRSIPALTGVLPYTDFCLGDVRGLLTDDGNVLDEGSLGATQPQLASFGEDNDGELYALALSGGIYRIAAG